MIPGFKLRGRLHFEGSGLDTKLSRVVLSYGTPENLMAQKAQ